MLSADWVQRGDVKGRWQLYVVITEQGGQGYTGGPRHTHTSTQFQKGANVVVVGYICHPEQLLVSKASAAAWRK